MQGKQRKSILEMSKHALLSLSQRTALYVAVSSSRDSEMF